MPEANHPHGAVTMNVAGLGDGFYRYFRGKGCGTKLCHALNICLDRFREVLQEIAAPQSPFYQLGRLETLVVKWRALIKGSDN